MEMALADVDMEVEDSEPPETSKRRLERFLIMGLTGKMCLDVSRGHETTGFIDRLISQEQSGMDVINTVWELYKKGMRPDPSMYTLAVCCSSNHIQVKRYAFLKMVEICRNSTPMYLFLFLHFYGKLHRNTKGWGRCMRRAISQYYNSFANDPMKLAYHVTKYRNRKKWSHKNVLRLAHVNPCNREIGLILAYASRGMVYANNKYPANEDNGSSERIRRYLSATEEVRHNHGNRFDIERLCMHIAECQLSLEHLPTQVLCHPRVWQTLMANMPLKCMLRNLGKMASLNLYGEGQQVETMVCHFLQSQGKIEESKLHPMDFILSLVHYRNGCSYKGKLNWQNAIRQKIEVALEASFFRSLCNVIPSEKQFLIAIDLGSKHKEPVKGVRGNFTIGDCISALVVALCYHKPNSNIILFGSDIETIVKVDHLPSKFQEFREIWLRGVSVSNANASTPIKYASTMNLPVDMFVIFTGGNKKIWDPSPHDCIQRYRDTSGIQSRLALISLLTEGDTAMDLHERDPLVMDFIGFDPDIVKAIHNFANR